MPGQTQNTHCIMIPSFSICKFETFSADQNWRKSLFLWIWDFLSWSEIEGKSFNFLPITCKSTLHETICKTLLHYKQDGNSIKKSANQNEKKSYVLHTSKFIVKSCPLLCLLWISTNLSTTTTSSIGMTKMVEKFVKSCWPNI